MVVNAAGTAARPSGPGTGQGAGGRPRASAGGFGRRQPPVYSPLPAEAIAGAAVSALRAGADDPRARLRARLCRRYDAEEAVLCGSGTQSLRLGLRIARRVQERAGRFVVALPAFTCFDVAAAAVAADARIALYDVDPATLGPDLGSLERTLASGASALVVAPLYGVPIEWDEVDALARRRGAVVVEDAAQGHGAAWGGRPLGGLGEISVLSFGRGKGWTGAAGGAVLVRGRAAFAAPTGRPPRAASVRVAVAAAATATLQWAFGRPSIYAIPASIPWLGLGETRYREPRPARGMSRFAAELLLRTDRAAAAEARRRRANADRLAREVHFGGGLRPVHVPRGGRAGFLRWPVRRSGGVAGLADRAAAARHGIAPTYPSTLAELPPVRSRRVDDAQRFPGAEELVRSLITLPTHSRVTPAERRALARIVHDTASDAGARHV